MIAVWTFIIPLFPRLLCARSLLCNSELCTSLLDLTVCEHCYTLVCDFLIFDSGSQCDGKCPKPQCNELKLGNGVCDLECNIAVCGFDMGDCGACAAGCMVEMLGNGKCDEECNVVECVFDQLECEKCREGCSVDMIGDGHCDPACYYDFCLYDKGDCPTIDGCNLGLLGNHHCDPKCDSLERNWDEGDCLCAPDCNTVLLKNSVCDPACNNELCSWDNGTQCEPACNVAECDFDNGSCDCALGCSAAQRGKCAKECLVLSCDFDGFKTEGGCTDEFLVTASIYNGIVKGDFNTVFDIANCERESPSCTLEMLRNANDSNECNENCFSPGCLFSMGQCPQQPLGPNCQIGYGAEDGKCFECSHLQFFGYCINACPRELSTYKSLPRLCVQSIDNSNKSKPDVMYMREDKTQTVYHVGDLYFNIMDALAAAWQHYTVINLIGEEITYNPTYVYSHTDNVDYLVHKNPPNLFDDAKWQHLMIRSQLCSEQQMQGCAEEPTTINFMNIATLQISDKELTFERVVITTRRYFQYVSFGYCPLFTKTPDGYLTDKGVLLTTVRSGLFQCKDFVDVSLFEVFSDATIRFIVRYTQNVDFRDVTIQLHSIINMKGGDVYLSNVLFFNVQPNVASTSHAIILQNQDCTSIEMCGSLTYSGGSVHFLNNGYEISANIRLNPFLWANSLTNIDISNVQMTLNAVGDGPATLALLHVANFLRFSILNSEFTKNFCNGSLIRIQSAVTFPTLNDPIVVGIYSRTHIVFKQVTFRSNFSSDSTIKISLSSELLNISIEDCTFDSNSQSLSPLIDISFLGALSDAYISGWLNEEYDAFIPPRYVTLKRSKFTHQSSFESLIRIDGCANVEIGSVNCVENTNTEQQNMKKTLQAFLDADGIYSDKMPDYGSDQECSSLLTLNSVYNSAITDLSISKSICVAGGTGIAYGGGNGSHTVSTFTSVENVGYTTSGTALTLTGGVTVSAANLSASKNYATTRGVIYINSSSLLLTNSLIEQNTGYTGTGIYADNVALLQIERTRFNANSAILSNGGALFVMPKFSAGAQFVIKSCQFTNNLARIGGAISLSFLSGASPVIFTITDSQFSGNAASDSGASLHTSSIVEFVSGALIDKCNFSGENSKGGAVTLLHISGEITISNSAFRGNMGETAAGINIQTATEAKVNLVSLIFEGNWNGPAVVKPNSLIFSTISSKKCTFRGNTNGGFYIERGKWTDDSSLFLSTNATAVLLTANSSAYLLGTQFQSNITPRIGGGVRLSSQSNFTCVSCLFVNNTAGQVGGGVYAEQDSSVNLRDCRFERNRAGASGSAVVIISSLVLSVINSTVFRENQAGAFGTISAQSSLIYLNSVTLVSNTAPDNPGVTLLLSILVAVNLTFQSQIGSIAPFVSLQISSNATISDSQFSLGIGGCFFVSSSSLTIVNTLITDIQGGLVSSQGSIVLYCDRVRAYRLRSDSSGSIIDSSESSIAILTSEFGYFSSGGVIGTSLSKLEIRGTKFYQGRGDTGGAVYCTRCNRVSIDSSEFTNVSSTVGAVYFDYSGNATISNTLFRDNTAKTAGGIFAQDLRLTMTNCVFAGNAANGTDGGAIYFDCSDSARCAYNLRFVEFRNNFANRAGGAIAWKVSKPKLENITFTNNQAVYGPDHASFPIKLVTNPLFPRILQSQTDYTNVPPGQIASISLSVALVDHYGQLVNIDNESFAELTSPDSSIATFSGLSKATAVKGVFTFNNFSVFADPKSEVQLSVVSSAIPSNNGGDEDVHVQVVDISFQMRGCVPGESIGTKSCLVCASGTYGFDPSKPCQNCLSNAKCLGKTVVLPNSGYWRSGIYSEKVWECPLPSSCLGGNPYNNGTMSVDGFCSSGYKSNMCQSCADEYSRSSKNKCGKCPELEINIVRIVFVTIAVVIFNAYLVYGAMKSATRPTALYSIYMKILVNYLQLVFLVTEFNLSWPQPVLDLFNAQENTGGVTEQIYSIDCFLSGNGDTSNVFYRKMIFMALLPFFVIAAIIVFWVAVAAYTKDTKYLKRELAASIVIAFFFIHPTLTKSLFSMFSCTQIDAGEYWLTVDMAIKCYSPEYLFYIFIVGIPAVTVWVFSVPLFCLGILIKFRRQQDELWIKLQYGFLINGYRRERYYWEFVVLFRKIAIICCSVFLTNSILIQALTVQLVLLFFYLLQHNIHPYTHFQLNSTESKGIIVADVTIYCGLYYLTDDLSEGSSWFFCILIVIFNSVFLIYWFFAVIGFFIDIFAGIFPSIGHKIRPEIFERDPYIDDFVTTVGDKNSNKYESFPSTDVMILYHCLLLSPRPFCNVIHKGTKLSYSYQPTVPFVNEDVSARSDSANIGSSEVSFAISIFDEAIPRKL